MMGHRQVAQAALFYEFSLEGHVSADHLLRSIDRFVELGELRAGVGRLLQLDGTLRSLSRLAHGRQRLWFG